MFVFGATAPSPPQWARASSRMRFLDHIQRRTTVGATPSGRVNSSSQRLLITHNIHKRQTSMPPVGFESTISAGERPADLRLRPRGRWDRLIVEFTKPNSPKHVSFLVSMFCFPHYFNPLKPELNPICYLLALLGAHHFLHVSRIRLKLLTFRLLMSYIYGAPILDVSRSHTTTQHSR